MSLDESLRVVSSVLSESGKLGVSVGAGRWCVLFGGRQRPLLLPVAEFSEQRKWLPIFIRGRVMGWYALALLKLNALIPAAGLLPEFRLRHPADGAALQGSLIEGGLANSGQVVMQLGTKGPYRKVSLLLLSERGEGLALAKISLAASADALVAAEAGWLRDLESVDGLAGEVPRLLSEGEVESGRRYLVTSLAPSARVTSAFTPAHSGFLARLGRARMQVMRFENSPCCEAIERLFDERASALTRADAAVLLGAMHDCRKQLHDFVGPFVSSQGDFASWNIRVNPPRIFVFDWEYAKSGANPLADLLHYHLIPRAAAGRAVGRWFLASVLRRAQAFGRLHYPETRWRSSKVSALALAYLLDVVLEYCRANGGMDHTDDVVKGYWTLLERRSTWMAA